MRGPLSYYFNNTCKSGGLCTRIRDHSENIKPMIPIGGKPILWHLMSYYSQHADN